MGVRTNHYVILGAKLEQQENDFERYEKFMDTSWKPTRSGLVVLSDGMSGEYTIVGHVLAATGNDESADYYFEPTEVELTPEMFAAARNDVREKLGLDITPKLIIVTHHT